MSNDIDSLRKQLITQVESANVDDKQKESLMERINNSSHEELLSLINQSQRSSGDSGGQCVFCSIFSGDVDSYKIFGDDNSVAVFEINPLSSGHVIIIPSDHGKISDIPENVKSMIKKVTDKIQSVLDPERVEVSKSEIMGHTIINVIPIYSDEKLVKKSADPKELEELVKKFSSEVIKADIKKEVIVIPQKVKRKRAIIAKPLSPKVEAPPIRVVKNDDSAEAKNFVSKPVEKSARLEKVKQTRYKAPSRIP